MSGKASAEFRAEIGMAISRLTQIIQDDEPSKPPERTYLVGKEEMSVWLDTKPAQILTATGDRQAVYLRGDIVMKYGYESDIYALSPVEAIAIGNALVAAGLSASTGRVVPIGGAS